MSRKEKRQVSKEILAIARKGKQAMAAWISNLGYIPSEDQIRAWQAGYIAGINNKED